MKSTLQAILICLVIFGAHGASLLRQKRQFNQGSPQFDQQRDPQFVQQVPQFGDGQVNPQFGQVNPQFGQPNLQFGQPNPQFGQPNSQFGQNQDPALANGQFVGFGQFRPNQNNPSVGNGLTIGANGRPSQFGTTLSPPPSTQSGRVTPNSGLTIPGQRGMNTGRQIWSIDSGPTTTTPIPNTVRTTPSQAYLRCLASCPSTMEYNPVCGSDEQNYHNMQRLVCANRCGNNVQMVRLGTCLPL